MYYVDKGQRQREKEVSLEHANPSSRVSRTVRRFWHLSAFGCYTLYLRSHFKDGLAKDPNSPVLCYTICSALSIFSKPHHRSLVCCTLLIPKSVYPQNCWPARKKSNKTRPNHSVVLWFKCHIVSEKKIVVQFLFFHNITRYTLRPCFTLLLCS